MLSRSMKCSYHLSSHLRATPEEGGVGIWEVVFLEKNPVINRGHVRDIRQFNDDD
jgi:hypothetical protein